MWRKICGQMCRRRWRNTWQTEEYEVDSCGVAGHTNVYLAGSEFPVPSDKREFGKFHPPDDMGKLPAPTRRTAHSHISPSVFHVFFFLHPYSTFYTTILHFTPGLQSVVGSLWSTFYRTDRVGERFDALFCQCLNTTQRNSVIERSQSKRVKRDRFL